MTRDASGTGAMTTNASGTGAMTTGEMTTGAMTTDATTTEAMKGNAMTGDVVKADAAQADRAQARMTIAVLGATGMVGSRVINEARARGHRVLALSRKPASEDPGVTPIAVDATDPDGIRQALAGSAGQGAADAVVLTVRTAPVDQEFLVGATRTVLDVAAELGIRVFVVGGAGVLRSPGDPGLLVADNPVYVPAELKAIAAAGVAQLRACQDRTGVDWVYLGPPALLEPGVRTGRYLRGTDTLLTSADGRSWISAEDLAVAVVDELETPGSERLVTVVHREGDPAA